MNERDIYNLDDAEREAFVEKLTELELRERLLNISKLICNDEYRDFVRDCGTDDLADAIASIVITGTSTYLDE